MKQQIVYFDGVCGLCNYFVDFLLRRDKYNKLLFAPLQGETASQNLGVDPHQTFDSVVFYKNGKQYTKSGAAIRILAELGGLWQLTLILLIIPAFIRNFVYDIVATNRYKWFGQKESCRIPTKEERVKFLP